LQIPGAGAAETHGGIERPLGRILHSLDAFGKIEAPGVPGGGTTGDGKHDDFAGFSFNIEILGCQVFILSDLTTVPIASYKKRAWPSIPTIGCKARSIC
jgi:hypothetical protein